MLLPRFKLRTALIALTVSGFISLLFREGARGTPWAIGAVIGLASLVLWLFVMALFFGAAMLFHPRQDVSSSASTTDSEEASNG